jgi:tetratricopeptide (TPR) repeat protein/predicted Ser/Thr protein kinase
MSELLARAAQLLEAALERPASARAGYVERECEGDEALCREVLSLLAVAPSGDAWLGDLAERVGDALTAGPQSGGGGAQSVTLSAGERVGAWRIDGPLGAGGMGEVYLASRADGRYEQRVALKTLRERLDSQAARSFERERERLARLTHAGISRIIDAGETPDGRPFMAMEYVDGERIDRWCQRRGLDLAARLRLLEQLCSAVAHAHGRLILHRDIKASNVLVDSAGKVRLIDFGISALLEEGEMSRGSSAPLTIASAAPEQLQGGVVSAQTDVFAIGLLAYQLLADRAPRRESNGSLQLDRQALPRRDLMAVIERATAYAPADRYPSADALREDFLALVEHRPIGLLRGDFAYRLSCTLRRFPLATALAATACLALLVGTVVSLQFADRAGREASRANQALEQARFYLDRAQVNASTQSAYADALQRLFGDEGDEDRMRGILLQHAAQAHEQHAQAPERAAEIAYAIGRHFVDRNDYATSLKVLEPWLQEGYGNDYLLTQGRLNQALAYRYTGQTEAAIALFERVDEAFSGTRDEHSLWHLLVIVQQAELLATRERWLAALSLLQSVVEGVQDPQTEMFCWTYIETFQKRLGNFDAAYEAAGKAVAVFERNPLLQLHGRVNTRSMLASYEIYHTGDFAAAQAHIRQALEDAKLAGEQGAVAELLYLRGELALFQERLQEAQDFFRRSRALELQYFPIDIGGSTALVETLAQAGAFEEARGELDALSQRLEELRPGRPPHPRVTLAQAFLAAHGGDIELARDVLAEAGFTQELAATSVVGMARVRRLLAMGVAVPTGK